MDADKRRFFNSEMFELNFAQYRIELLDESDYVLSSTANISAYEKVFSDGEDIYHATKHGIKVYEGENIFSSANIFANGGATGIHKNSAVIVNNDILICCANKIFSLSLSDLNLNWIKQVDDVTCFQIFKINHGNFVHGELEASKIDAQGNIIWSVGFEDILVTPDGMDSFVIHENFVEITDWNYRKYKVNFDGEFI